MGLDAGFIAKKNGVEVEISWFRNYHTLDRWIRDNCETIEDDYLFRVTADKIEKLENEISSFCRVLHRMPIELVEHFDEEGYEKKRVGEAFYYSSSDFNPVSNGSGWKLLKLGELIPVLLNILAGNDGVEIHYYSSY